MGLDDFSGLELKLQSKYFKEVARLSNELVDLRLDRELCLKLDKYYGIDTLDKLKVLLNPETPLEISDNEYDRGMLTAKDYYSIFEFFGIS